MDERTLAELCWRFDDQAFNRGDLSVVDELVHPDFVNHDPLLGQGTDRDAIRDYVPVFRKAFPDLRCRNEMLVVQGDEVAHILVFTGTQRGEFAGQPARGQRLTIRSHDFQRWQNGKMIERWSQAGIEGLTS